MESFDDEKKNPKTYLTHPHHTRPDSNPRPREAKSSRPGGAVTKPLLVYAANPKADQRRGQSSGFIGVFGFDRVCVCVLPTTPYNPPLKEKTRQL